MHSLKSSIGASERLALTSVCSLSPSYHTLTHISSGWIDISLTVTPTTVNLLFGMLADQSLPIRLATSLAILRVVSKGLKEPGDKLQLIKVLSLGQVLKALESKTRQQQIERGDDTDEGEEAYREALGRMLNALGLELMKLIEVGPRMAWKISILILQSKEPGTEEIRNEATSYLEQILPVMLRFMEDDYDDTASTVFPMLQVVLAMASSFLGGRVTKIEHLIFAVQAGAEGHG